MRAVLTSRSANRDYWLLWAGSGLSNLGDGIRLTALPLLAATLTRDPLAVGAVLAATLLRGSGSDQSADPLSIGPTENC
jgi:hypothetical protein